MLSLSQATKETRMLLKFGGIFLGIILILFFLFRFGDYLRLQFFPPLPIPPEEKFGKLPVLRFPEQNYTVKFKVNTISGSLPIFPDRIKVYKIQEKNSGLFDLQNARNDLNKVGFNLYEARISDTVYKWYSSQGKLNKEIEYDIISKNFNIYSDYLSEESLDKVQALKEGVSFQNIVVDFLRAINQDINDLDLERARFTYYKILGSEFSEVNDNAEAKIVKVSLIQNPIDNIEIYYQDFMGSNMNFIVGDVNGINQILESSFVHLMPNLSDFSEYGLKTSEQAFQDLQDGKGYVFNPKNKTMVDIKDVYVGYFLSDSEKQKYLYPIAIFSGNDFLAYITLLP